MFRNLNFSSVAGIAVLTGILLFAAGCGGGAGSVFREVSPVASPTAGGTRTTGHYGSLQFVFTTSKALYSVGETASFILVATNTGQETVRVSYIGVGNGGLLIRQGETEVYRLPTAAGAADGLEVSLKPGESQTYETNWVTSMSGQYTAIGYVRGNGYDNTQVDPLDLAAAPLTINVQ